VTTSATSATDPALLVAIADDHERAREGARRLLARDPGIRVAGEADDGAGALRLVAAHAPDVLLLDLHMPGAGGLQVLPELRARFPRTAVLVLTVSDADADVTDALLAGAAGYVLKDASAAELVGAVRAAAGGEAFVSPRVAARLLNRWRALRAAPRRAAALSPRELEVLRLMAEGAENGEIAEALTISANTVKRHVAAILTKLGAANRTEAAVTAVRTRLI
jgi:DNA-binding NarL/FixJ family response regulator